MPVVIQIATGLACLLTGAREGVLHPMSLDHYSVPLRMAGPQISVVIYKLSSSSHFTVTLVRCLRSLTLVSIG